MIRDDIENLNFKELTDLEQQEYVAILTLNIRKVILQLMNSGDTQLATLFSICTAFATHNPAKLYDLLQYATKLYEIYQVELDTVRKGNEIKVEQEKAAAPKDEFPDLDSEKEN